MMKRYYAGSITANQIGKSVKIFGWIQNIRDHGGVLFVDVRDREGIIQTVWPDYNNSCFNDLLSSLKPEELISVIGKVRKRPEESINYQLETGELEILGEEVCLINTSLPLPFDISKEYLPAEPSRMKFRYLDLRREKMNKNILKRSQISKMVRDYFHDEGFIEVETPLIVKYTPGGARNFLIPSRAYPGKFYALAESPQIYKQLLMISGIDKYFQIVKCFRDEDPRSDRQIEFTQIDVELSFADREQIIKLVENLFRKLWKNICNIDISLPFKILTYQESMNRFGTDKPDLRFGLEISDLTNYYLNSSYSYLCNAPFVGGIFCSQPEKVSRKYIQIYDDFIKSLGGNGVKIFKYDDREKDEYVLNDLFQEFNFQTDDLLFVIAGEKELSLELLGFLRKKIIEVENLQPSQEFEFVWIVDFPLFETNNDDSISSKHHPFTSPIEEDIPLFSTTPLKMRAKAYDIVVNGIELGGGSLRIINSDTQKMIFRTLGLTNDEVEEKFGFLLKALSYAAPPHGGIALGFDRLVSVLLGEDSIREVIAFPKTTSAFDPLTDAPSFVDQDLLKVLKLKIEE